MRHALVKDGEFIEYRNYAPIGNQNNLAPGKPRMLPVVTIQPAFNPITHVQEGPVREVEANRVVERYTNRQKNPVEIAAMIAEKAAAIDAEFGRLYRLPITHTVGGVEYQFHADDQARENMTGVLQMYYEADRMGSPLPDPRTWTPFGSNDPIAITRAELAVLAMKIGARKDALHTTKKTRQKALAAMTNPVLIDAVDPLTGWDIA
jgi:hypothetical protein